MEHQTKTSNPIPVLETYLTASIVFLLPLIVLPIFPNIFDTAKLAVFVLLLAILLVIKAVKVVQRGRIEFTTGSFDLPLILLAILYIVGTYTRTPNRMEALFLPGTTTFIVSGVVLYFVINQLNEAQKNVVKTALIASGAVFSFISLVAISGALGGATSLPAIMRQTFFNTLGGPLVGLMFLLVTLPFAVTLSIKSMSISTKVLSSIAAILIIFGLIINLVNSLPGRPSSPNMVGFNTSWTVAVDSLKGNALFGVGPANYLTAFNLFRPVDYNSTELWTVRFSTARNYFLTMFTEGGLLVLGALILIVIKLVRDASVYLKSINSDNWMNIRPSFIALWVLIAMMLLFPATLPIVVLLFVLLALNSNAQRMAFNLSTTQERAENSMATRFPALIAALPVLVFVLFVLVNGMRMLAAENTYKRALDAIATNQGGVAYDLLRQAIQTNPYVDRYHGTYTQINLALANAVAGKDDITDEDRNTIAQLVQQAIREGKSTVSLNPTRAGNWELLASTYRAIIPLARGADQYAVQSYNQAIALDPLNTNYRIALGGILYAAEQYDAAIDVFKLAVLTKSDFANAHYNLAAAYREDGNTEMAIQHMTRVLSLVNRDSEDYNIARQQLEELQSGRATQGTDGEELTEPGSDINEPALDPQLELPEDAQPPASPEDAEEESAEEVENDASPSATPLP